MKLAYSADGAATHVPADADGLLVNLGANNDVTVTGSVTATLAAGTNAYGKLSANSGVDIGDVDVTSVIPGTGATNLGKAEDAAHASGDVGVMMLAVRTDIEGGGPLSGASLDYEPLHTDEEGRLRVNARLTDQNGEVVSLVAPVITSVVPTLDTSAVIAGDSMSTAVLQFANAAIDGTGSGHILRMTVIDDDDLGATADFLIHFFESSVTPATVNTAHSLSDGDADEYIDSISTADGTWRDHALNQTLTIRPSPPIPFKLDSGTTLYAVIVAVDGHTHTASGLEIKLQIQPD
jgi:hypothetical protein